MLPIGHFSCKSLNLTVLQINWVLLSLCVGYASLYLATQPRSRGDPARCASLVPGLSAQFALWKWMKQLSNFTHLDVRLPLYWHLPSGLEGKLKFANNPENLPPSDAGFKSAQDIRKREYCCDLQMLLIHLTSGLDVLVMFEVMGQ